ncbi:hypothetical protein E6C27_scaffold465G00250 [Cucumis melo var. makuwa]|uniref:Uncharacterized protein n=1 Tax=Cucumis melo var. makuwa TaxID=1194695 RepID=A0A5A7SR53_CUCMM|nr:hypothetical protein E6C27_scaffold465G00250 [Cucumis melo var. makuwa]
MSYLLDPSTEYTNCLSKAASLHPNSHSRIIFLLQSLPRFLCLTLQPNSQLNCAVNSCQQSSLVFNSRIPATTVGKWIILTHRLTTNGSSSSSRSRWTLPATTNVVHGEQTHDATTFDNSSVFPLCGLSEVGYNKQTRFRVVLGLCEDFSAKTQAYFGLIWGVRIEA